MNLKLIIGWGGLANPNKLLDGYRWGSFLTPTCNGKSKMSALGAAMRKLVQICFGVIKHQQPYQPQVNI